MSSFFTLPASQRKRKREDRAAAPAAKKRGVTANGESRTKSGGRPREREESISGSDLNDDDEDVVSAEGGSEADSGSESDAGETAAEKRLRLAERYLENIREEVDEAGFDAAEIDRDLIAERLKEDVVGLSVCGMFVPTKSLTSGFVTSRMNLKAEPIAKLPRNSRFQQRPTAFSVQTLSRPHH